MEPGSGKHSVYTHFPKDPNLVEDDNNKGFLQKTYWYSRAPKFSVKKVNRETIIDMPWWYKIWHTQWIQSYPCKTKTSQETQKSLMKFLEPTRKPKVSFTLTIPRNVASLARNYPVIIVRQHHSDHKQMGLLREQCVELRKGHLRYCCNQVWMKNGGQIPRNAAAICEILTIFCLMGRDSILKGGSECHLTDQLSRLEQWSNITLFLRKSNLDCISLEQKTCQVYSLDMCCPRRDVERRHCGRRH